MFKFKVRSWGRLGGLGTWGPTVPIAPSKGLQAGGRRGMG